jgi:hypothetical protein
MSGLKSLNITERQGFRTCGCYFRAVFFSKKEYIMYKYTRVNVLRCIRTREKSKSREITRHTGVLRVATQLYRESSRHYTSSFSESTIPCARAHVCVCVCVGLVSYYLYILVLLHISRLSPKSLNGGLTASASCLLCLGGGGEGDVSGGSMPHGCQV